MKVQIKSEVEVDIDLLAEIFANFDDDQQAKFFVKVAEIGKAWGGSGDFQWYSIGSHLRNCSCSTDAARDMIRSMHDGLENGNH